MIINNISIDEQCLLLFLSNSEGLDKPSDELLKLLKEHIKNLDSITE